MPRLQRVPTAALPVAGALGLLSLDVLGGASHVMVAIGLLLAVVGMTAVAKFVASWPRALAGLLLTVLLIPSDGRYILPAGLPFQLEPYRLVVGFLLAGWLASLLVDPRVRARATGFETPLLMIVIATVGSEVVNPGRVSGISSYVIKALWLFACLVLVVYMIASLVRSRETIERLLVVLVCGGSVIAVSAALERRAGFNIFNHLRVVLPIFDFHPVSVATRDGHIRSLASSGHPIELSATLSMLIPLALYLAISRRKRVWWLILLILTIGEFSSDSKTGVLALAAMIVLFAWLRPRQTLRFSPALLPLLVIVHFADPSALGSIYGGFFPSQGFVAQQSETFNGMQTTRLSRLGPSMHEFAQYNPLFGQGYGTRITGATTVAGNGQKDVMNPADNAQILDDQWLKTLLETGVLGLLGWLWLFGGVIRKLVKRARVQRDSPDGWLPAAIAASLLGFALTMLTYDAFSFTQATFLGFALIGLAASVLALPSAAPQFVPRLIAGTPGVRNG